MTVGTLPRLKAIPPDRGSFPLDHDGVCRELVNDYVKCIGELKGNALECRHLAAKYMQCRIDNKLLAEEPLANFGFREHDINPAIKSENQVDVDRTALLRSRQERKESKGFVAGGSVIDNYAKEESFLSRMLSKVLK